MSKSETLYSAVESTPFSYAVSRAHCYFDRAIPAEFLKQYPDVYDTYDLDGNPLRQVELKDGEVLVPKKWKKKVVANKYNVLLGYLKAFKFKILGRQQESPSRWSFAHKMPMRNTTPMPFNLRFER